MPEYVYGCANPEHPRETVVHGMNDNPDLWCRVCGGKLHRIPQAFTWGWHPTHALFNTMEERFTSWKQKYHSRQSRS